MTDYYERREEFEMIDYKKKDKGKEKKKIIVIILAGFVLCIIGYLLFGNNFIPHRQYGNEDYRIETYVSQVDKDGDRIDDQTDILKGAEKYIEKKPKYKSKYYETGYPNDEYGVCTDVVAWSLLDAGYNLQELVSKDIKENGGDYPIEEPDANIDFRRVKNMNIYFQHTAISLTTDINEISEWQGGDIVVFKKHIGIIAGVRNKNGIPFVIHHTNPMQIRYVEDILEHRNDIVGHYRIS